MAVAVELKAPIIQGGALKEQECDISELEYLIFAEILRNVQDSLTGCT